MTLLLMAMAGFSIGFCVGIWLYIWCVEDMDLSSEIERLLSEHDA